MDSDVYDEKDETQLNFLESTITGAVSIKETYHWLAKVCENAPFYVHSSPIIKIFRKKLYAASGSISGHKIDSKLQ